MLRLYLRFYLALLASLMLFGLTIAVLWHLSGGPLENVGVSLGRLVQNVLPAAQAQLSDFIAGVVAGWDTDTITDRLELSVGKDLQYVRVNGTLVGFLVGGFLFVLLHLIFGHVSF